MSWSLWSLSPDRKHWMEVGSGMLQAEAEQAVERRMDYARRHNFDGVFIAMPAGRQPGPEHVPHPVTAPAGDPRDVAPPAPEPDSAPTQAQLAIVCLTRAADATYGQAKDSALAEAQVHATLALVEAVKALRWSQ